MGKTSRQYHGRCGLILSYNFIYFLSFHCPVRGKEYVHDPGGLSLYRMLDHLLSSGRHRAKRGCVFRGGAFGMGLTTSISHLVQLLILFRHFLRPEHYFRLSPKLMRSFQPYQVFRNGTPSLIKEICTTLRDILTNNINVLTALSAAAIAARGIQLDIYTFLLCIPLGLGKSMVSMTGIFHSANDSSSWTSVRFQGSSGIDRFQPHSSVAFHIYNKLHTLQGDSETT